MRVELAAGEVDAAGDTQATIRRQPVTVRPVQAGGDRLQSLNDTACRECRARDRLLARPVQILQTEFDGIDPESLRKHVGVRFDGERPLRTAEAAERAAKRVVRVHHVAVIAIRGESIQRPTEHRLRQRHTRSVRGVRAIIEHDSPLPGGDGAVALDAGLDVQDLWVAGPRRGKFLITTVNHLDGSSGGAREVCGAQVDGVRLALAAEAAAEIRRDDADFGRRQSENTHQREPIEKRGLRRHPEGDAAGGVPVGDAAVRLHTHVALARGHEAVFEHEVRLRKTLVDVPTDHAVVRNNVAFDAVVQRRCALVHGSFGVVHTG